LANTTAKILPLLKWQFSTLTKANQKLQNVSI